jgi:hypothetical protein
MAGSTDIEAKIEVFCRRIGDEAKQCLLQPAKTDPFVEIGRVTEPSRSIKRRTCRNQEPARACERRKGGLDQLDRFGIGHVVSRIPPVFDSGP